MIQIVRPDKQHIVEICKVTSQYSDELGWVSHGEVSDCIDRNEIYIAQDIDLGKIVGAVLFHTRLDGLTRLYSIFVDKQYSGSGIGRQLFNKVPTPLILSCPECSISGRRFYESLGLTLNRIKDGKRQKLYEYILE